MQAPLIPILLHCYERLGFLLRHFYTSTRLVPVFIRHMQFLRCPLSMFHQLTESPLHTTPILPLLAPDRPLLSPSLTDLLFLPVYLLVGPSLSLILSPLLFLSSFKPPSPLVMRMSPSSYENPSSSLEPTSSPGYHITSRG